MKETTRGPPSMKGATPSGPGSCHIAFAQHAGSCHYRSRPAGGWNKIGIERSHKCIENIFYTYINFWAMKETIRGPPLMNGATPSGPGSCRVAFAEHAGTNKIDIESSHKCIENRFYIYINV